jgi:hypothetical protein
MDKNWLQNLPDAELGEWIEISEMEWLQARAYANWVAEENAGMLPNNFEEIETAAIAAHWRYKAFMDEISRRIQEWNSGGTK